MMYINIKGLVTWSKNDNFDTKCTDSVEGDDDDRFDELSRDSESV
jgi:hypothetical protein